MIFEINGVEWHVEFVAPGSNLLRRSDGSLSVGVTDNLTRTVYLSNLLHGRFLDKVISHELCHVWCFMNNIYMPIEVEEQVADFLATYGRDIFYMADFVLSNLTENEIYA